jgi:hypothetical protein
LEIGDHGVLNKMRSDVSPLGQLLFAAALCVQSLTPALAQPKPAATSPKVAPVVIDTTPATTLIGFAKQKNFSKCMPSIAKFEAVVLRDFEYAFSARVDSKRTAAKPMAVVIDARNRTTQARTLLNVTFAPSADAAGGCSTVYEQTIYHSQRCEPVQQAMAPAAVVSSRTVYGAVVLDLAPTLVLSLIPVGSGQCITVVKELDF